jgi:hypothetical protein
VIVSLTNHMFLGQVRDGLTDLVRSIHEGRNAMYTQRTAIAAAVEARQAHQRNTWAAFDEVCMFICMMHCQRVYKQGGCQESYSTSTHSRQVAYMYTRSHADSWNQCCWSLKCRRRVSHLSIPFCARLAKRMDLSKQSHLS